MEKSRKKLLEVFDGGVNFLIYENRIASLLLMIHFMKFWCIILQPEDVDNALLVVIWSTDYISSRWLVSLTPYDIKYLKK